MLKHEKFADEIHAKIKKYVESNEGVELFFSLAVASKDEDEAVMVGAAVCPLSLVCRTLESNENTRIAAAIVTLRFKPEEETKH